jgi:hypothetical protein
MDCNRADRASLLSVITTVNAVLAVTPCFAIMPWYLP